MDKKLFSECQATKTSKSLNKTLLTFLLIPAFILLSVTLSFAAPMTYFYDDAGRLIVEDGNEGAVEYVYDQVGNLLQKNVHSNQHMLSVTKKGNGNGTVTGGGIYNSGTYHQITATPDANSSFAGWSGDCDGSASPLDVLVDRPKTCTATFSLKIVVTRPNGGESFTGGSNAWIYWTYAGGALNVKIELYKNGVFDSEIIPSISTYSSPLNWIIPNTQTPGSDYKIKITSTTDDTITDISDGHFTINAPTITLTYPNGGGSYTAGSNAWIGWTFTGNPGALKIDLYKNNVFDSEIASSVNVYDGKFNWMIPVTQTPGADYSIKITSANSSLSDVTDMSDGHFTINAPTIKVTWPNGGESYFAGNLMMIRWTFSGNSGYVKIELYKNDVLDSTISPSTYIYEDGFDWHIPATQTPGADYKIKITATNPSLSNVTDVSDGNFTINAPTITLISPNGGESFSSGTTQQISWTETGYAGDRKIELYKNGVLDSTITPGTWGTYCGTSICYSWTIPGTQPSGTDYKIKITGTDNTSVTDMSDNNFTIIQPITVTSPNGGESWHTGNVYQINWSYIGNPGQYVKIELYKNGAFNSIISSSTSIGSNGSGSYTWMVPFTQALGDDYKIKITSTTNSIFFDTSDSDFTIIQPITITSPNGGESWISGNIYQINWSYIGNPGQYVKIELYKNGAFNSIISSSTSIGSNGSGSFTWTIPSLQTSGSDYKVKITSTADDTVTDVSDGNSTIVQPIIVFSPNGGEIWSAGDIRIIYWNSTGNPGYVQIDLYKNGVFSRTLTQSGSNGSFTSIIPSTQAPGTDYKIKITSMTNSSWMDMSDGNFTINAPTVTVTDPNGGEIWSAGDARYIKWNYTGNPGYVQIDLYKNGVFSRTLTQSGSNGSFTSIIPATQAPGADYKIKITATDPNLSSVTDMSNGDFTINAPTVTVTYPNGGESLSAGNYVPIKWRLTGNPGNVKIELYKGDVLDRTITSGTPGSDYSDGNLYFPWTIPATQTPGTNYKIKITAADPNLSNVTDMSDGNFTINAPTVTVTYPNGGESLSAGNYVPIKWKLTGNPGNVKIELYKGDVLDRTITSGTPGSDYSDGNLYFPWTIPFTQAPGSDYKIKITATDPNLSSVMDTSDGNFTIVQPITVTSPNGGERWFAGNTYTINWSYTGNPGTNVKIELNKGGTLSTISSSTPIGSNGSGSLPWTIPATQTLGVDYQIKITSTSNSNYADTSDITFEIALPTITASAGAKGSISPSGTVPVNYGSSQTFTITPNPAYHVADVLVDGSSVGAVTTYQFNNVTVDHTISAAFAINQYTVTASAGANGSLDATTPSPAIVNHGSATSFKFNSDAGFHVAGVSGCGGTTYSNADNSVTTYTYTTGPITGDCPVTATFAINPGITVTTPNGGESWTRGTTQTINWSYAGDVGSTVKIVLFKGGVKVGTLAVSVPIGSGGSGSWDWTIPANQTVGSDYIIGVASETYAAYKDVSDANFSITDTPVLPGITVIYPNGGEVLVAGSTYQITWTYTGDPGANVDIELYKGGVLHSVIVSNVSIGSGGSGSYTWSVAPIEGSDYSIRIASTTGAYEDSSNGYFTITTAPQTPSITLTAPNGGQVWQRGTTQTITWNYTGNPGSTVKIALFKAGVNVLAITDSTSIGSSGSGSYNWAIPVTLTAGSDYRIKIVITTDSTIKDLSDNTFTIQ